MRRSSEQLAEMDWWVGLKPGLLEDESSLCLNNLFSVTTNGVCPNGSVGGDAVKGSWWPLLVAVLLCDDLLVTCTLPNGSDPNWSSCLLVVDGAGPFFLDGVSLTPLVKGTDPNTSVCTGGLGLWEFSREGALILPFVEENGCCPNKSTSSDSWWASNGVIYGLAFFSCCLGLKSNVSWTWATGWGLWACCTCRWGCCCLFTVVSVGLRCSTPTAPCCWMFLRGGWGEAVMGSCSDRDWLGVAALGLSLAMIEVVWTCWTMTLWRKML